MTDSQANRLKTCCRHIRHKMMYGDSRHETVTLVDDSSSTRVFFCIKTFDALGPDQQPSSPDRCTQDRDCYCP